MIRYGQFSSTGTLDAVGAGSIKGCTAVPMGRTSQRVKSLSALCVLDVETNTITVEPQWQVSNDNSTWVDIASQPHNPANVVLGTGTAGADASITKVVPAPAAVEGWAWARLGLKVGVTTGATVDTYTVSYAYRQVLGAEG